MFSDINVSQLLTGVALLGGAVAVVVKWLSPALKLSKTVELHSSEINYLKENSISQKEHLKRAEQSDRLLCKAMVALIDNQLTGNSVDNLRTTKTELMEFLTGALK